MLGCCLEHLVERCSIQYAVGLGLQLDVGRPPEPLGRFGRQPAEAPLEQALLARPAAPRKIVTGTTRSASNMSAMSKQ